MVGTKNKLLGVDTIALEDWLSLTIEEPIDPYLPICDPHHHLWDGPGDRGKYLLDEFFHDVGGGHNLKKTIFVECGASYRENGPEEMKPVGETEFARDQAEKCADTCQGKTSVAEGIVAFADLCIGEDINRVLEAHMQAADNRLKGIRQICAWDPDPNIVSMGNNKGMMLETGFREGFACLSRYGLVFDAWQYFAQLSELGDLAKASPDTTIVVNHTGGPLGIGVYRGKQKAIFEEWMRNISDLAECPNIHMKLGGLGMPRCGFGWHERSKPPGSKELADKMAPYYEFCLEKFGIERCMFESNFPIDKVSYSYTVLWNMFKRITRDFSPQERSALFYDNAVKVYRLS